jgi:hypothetical protein
MRKSLGILTVLYCLVSTANAQERPDIKFGKITPADFTINSPLVDSNANAVVIADFGSSEFEGNMKGWFSITFKRHKRIKILNKNGFDAATVSIMLYGDYDNSEKLDDLRAVTHNLENGTVVTTKLEKKDILEEKPRKNFHPEKIHTSCVESRLCY